MNRGLKLIATFWLFAAAVAAGQLLRTLVFPFIEGFGRGNPGLGSAIVTVIAVAPIVLVIVLTRAWRRDLRILLQTDYWKSLLVVGAQRARARSRSLAPSRVRNRPTGNLGGEPGTRGYLHRNRVTLFISLGALLVTLALVAAYGMSRDRSGEWVTIRNPTYTHNPTWTERIRAIDKALEGLASDTLFGVNWELPEVEQRWEELAIIHSHIDNQIAALPQGVEKFEFMTLAASSISPQSTPWRIRFKLPAEVRTSVDEIAKSDVQIVAFVSLTDRDGYVLDTAEWPLNDATFPDLGRWACLGDDEKKRRLAALGPTLVFKGSDEGDFLPGQARSITLSFGLRDRNKWDYWRECGRG